MLDLGEGTEISDEFALLGLPRPLVSGLARRGITAPFPIQRAAIPDVLAGHDVLGRGQTGSGKTLAFGLPTMARVAGDPARPKRPLALILVPTRELALQVTDSIEPLGRGLALRTKTIVGGMSMSKQIESLRRGVEIIVATPGRLTDLIKQGECSLEDVLVTVLDEADHMCDLGFLPVVSALLEQTPADGQRLLFSATLDGDVDKLVKRFLTDPVVHSVDPAVSSVETMEHHLVQVHRDDKVDVTAEIANREGRTILFVRTQHGVDRVVKQLARVGVKAGALHGGKRQNQRTRILGDFRDGKVSVLVCTDVAARGIHVDDVSLVLHVDPPADHKSYLHRGGRTARAGERGTVLTLVLPSERRSTDSMTRKAGVSPTRHQVKPGDPILAEIAGARTPSGEAVPIWEPDVRKPLRPRQDDRSGRGDRSGNGRFRQDRNRFDRPRDDRPRDDRPGFDRPRDDRPGYDRPREDRFGGGRDERPSRFNRFGDDRRGFERARDDRRGLDRSRDERPRDDRPRDERPRDERPRDGRPGFDRPRDDRPGYDRPREDRSGGGRDERSIRNGRFGDDRRGYDRSRDDRSRDDRSRDDRSRDERGPRRFDDRGRENGDSGFRDGARQGGRPFQGERRRPWNGEGRSEQGGEARGGRWGDRPEGQRHGGRWDGRSEGRSEGRSGGRSGGYAGGRSGGRPADRGGQAGWGRRLTGR
jgi:superfamily II DNA/RNA helicase